MVDCEEEGGGCGKERGKEGRNVDGGLGGEMVEGVYYHKGS